MALAVSAPRVETSTSTPARAATWTSISAAVSLVATVPLVWMLIGPLSQIMFVRGTEHDGNWSFVFMIALILTAPATYALFFGTAGELLKPRVEQRVHTSTMRIAALGFVPYVVLAITAVYWDSGPRQSLVIAAGLTVPIAMGATIWASARQP